MEKDIRQFAQEMFDSIRHEDETGNEYWEARELAEVLEYKWQSFEGVIAKAKVSLSELGQAVDDHFTHVRKMVTIGSGAGRSVSDIKLTRYACYMITQSADATKKPSVAAAHAYFALQTRKQELTQQRQDDMERLIARHKFTESDRHVSEVVLDKGMAPGGLATIKSSGDTNLFGGKSTKQMKAIYGITNPKTPLANRMPNVVLAAKSLANEMTATNLETYPIDTLQEIIEENDGNNAEVRKALGSRGIVPEKLPPAEDTAKIMSRVKAQDKKGQLTEPND